MTKFFFFFGPDHHPASTSGVMGRWGEGRCHLKTPRLSEPSLSEMAAAAHQTTKRQSQIFIYVENYQHCTASMKNKP